MEVPPLVNTTRYMVYDLFSVVVKVTILDKPEVFEDKLECLKVDVLVVGANYRKLPVEIRDCCREVD
jgi:hypothetical protein